MRPACRILAATIFVVVSIIAAACCRAEILPSFSDEEAAWEATHIVVATEGNVIDGRLQVLESWKGDAKPGDTIELPELAVFKDEAARQIDRTQTSAKETPAQRGVKLVTGQRMVLFLIKKHAERGEKGVGSANDSLHWFAAVRSGSSEHGIMPVSVAWLESGYAYAIQQVKNPGPANIMPLEYDASGLRKYVDQVISQQRELEEIGKTSDPIARAKTFARRVGDKSWFVRRRAFRGISECGPQALPVLREILNDESLSRVHGNAVQALAATKGVDAVPHLVQLIEEEIEFWREAAPELEVGWWNGKGLDDKRQSKLHDRYGRVVQAVFALQRHPDPRAADAVTRLRDFWRSLPQLEGRSGISQISETCDSILKKLAA